MLMSTNVDNDVNKDSPIQDYCCSTNKTQRLYSLAHRPPNFHFQLPKNKTYAVNGTSLFSCFVSETMLAMFMA